MWTSGDAQRRFESAFSLSSANRASTPSVRCSSPACSSKENREVQWCPMHNVSQDVSLGPAVASCGLVTSGGTAVGAIKRHLQCAGDRRVAGVARRHVPGHMSIGARTACCLRHSICWLRDDTRAPMTKRASSRRRSGECALLLRPLNLRYLIGWRCAGLSVDWAARNCGGFAQQLLWHARATKAGVQQARCLSKQDSLHG